MSISFPNSPGGGPPSPKSFGDPFTVDVTVTGEQPHGNLNNLTFAGGQPLQVTPSAALQVVSGPSPPGSFSLSPGESRVFRYRMKAVKLGHVGLSSQVSGLDETGAPVSGSDSADLIVGVSLKVELSSLARQDQDSCG